MQCYRLRMCPLTESSHAAANASLQDSLKASLHEASPQEYELDAEVSGGSDSEGQPAIYKQGPGAVIECWRSAGKPLRYSRACCRVPLFVLPSETSDVRTLGVMSACGLMKDT